MASAVSPYEGIQLGFPPQPDIRIARPQQGDGRVLARCVLVRDLAKLVSRLHASPVWK